MCNYERQVENTSFRPGIAAVQFSSSNLKKENIEGGKSLILYVTLLNFRTNCTYVYKQLRNTNYKEWKV